MTPDLKAARDRIDELESGQHIAELDLTYQRIDELVHSLRQIIAASQDRKIGLMEFRDIATRNARIALSHWGHNADLEHQKARGR